MPLSFARGNRVTLVSIILIVFSCTSLFLWLSLVPKAPTEDTLLRRAYEQIATVRAYTQSVQTEVQLADRLLQVDGRYYHNGAESRFASIATTTLVILNGKKSEKHSFTLQNISIYNDVYTKIDTESDILRSTIPHTPLWQHFKKDSIPEQFVNISVSGPVLDNLLLFNENGAFLDLVQSHGSSKWGDTSLEKYTLKLSNEAPMGVGGTLGTLLGRIGKDGHVEVWIESESAIIRYMVFTGENYVSTTSISAINTPYIIKAPSN